MEIRVRVLLGFGVLGAAAGDRRWGGGGGGAAGFEIGGDGGGLGVGTGVGLGEVGDGFVAAVEAEVALDLLLGAAAAEEGFGVGVVPTGEADLCGGALPAVRGRR